MYFSSFEQTRRLPAMLCRMMLRFAGVALCAAALPAWGCIGDQAPIVRAHNILPATESGFSLHQFDLLTIMLPGEYKEGWRIEMEPIEPHIIQAVSDKDFEEHLHSKRFMTMSIRKIDSLTDSATATQLHFAAAGAGNVSLKLSNDQFNPARIYTMSIKISPVVIPPPPPRGSVRRADVSQIGKVIEISFYDKLEITLPGKVDDDWYTSSANAVGLNLIGKRPADASGSVVLTFDVSSLGMRDGTMLLVPKHPRTGQAAVYQFQIRYLLVPLC